jgi:hypothetical protein
LEFEYRNPVRQTYAIILRPERPYITNCGVPARLVARTHRTPPAQEGVVHLKRGLVDGEDLGQVVPERGRERLGFREVDERAVGLPGGVVEAPFRCSASRQLRPCGRFNDSK